jgi:hypothetical protein
VDVVIGGGSVPAVEVLLHDALSRAGPPFAQVRLLHRSADKQQDDDAEIDERSRARLVEELGLRVKPSPSWRVGKDRLCAALGALALDDPHQPPAEDTAWVVVDSGTALTVNVVVPSPKAGTHYRTRLRAAAPRDSDGGLRSMAGGGRFRGWTDHAGRGPHAAQPVIRHRATA